MPITLLRSIVVDNHWYSQKSSVWKSTVGNEPYIEGAALLGGSFGSICRTCQEYVFVE